MPDKLKLCRCGAMPRMVKFQGRNELVPPVYQVMCFSCNTKPKPFGRGATEQKAIDAWNNRVGEGEKG